ncbi:MAG TPA: FlgD immunoglobulin-like domain containing protein [Candidatus Latescibacteria bacterium]|jgi:hypothetical protein|nr:FlgD immunoglobulin-like domain containing protein [Candidatus Latescibacterota bacterium]HJP31884.1 FlgD immunoglobulin-like domain containing protein [Candidatus Latescibacterota bacterium]
MSGRQSIGSYGILALHSALLKKNSEIHDGSVGVNDFSPPPYQSDGVEFVVGIGSRTDEDVRLTGPQVKVKSNAMIDGLLAYHDLVSVGSGVVIGQEAQLAVPNWPLFTEAELPEFVSGVPGTAVIDVSQGGTESLTPGAYDLVKVRKNGSLTLEAGEYSIREFDAGDFTTTYFEGPTQLLVKERFQVSKQSVFGPDPQSQISATDILVYVEGINGINGNVGSTPKAAKIGLGARLQANVYAPNGTVYLRQNSNSTGAFIGKWVIVGIGAEVTGRNGWTSAPASKSLAPILSDLAARMSPRQDLQHGSFPNPSNPATLIHFSVNQRTSVRLTIYNALGQRVATLMDDVVESGQHRVRWDGVDARGRHVATGVYLYRLATFAGAATGRIVLMR